MINFEYKNISVYLKDNFNTNIEAQIKTEIECAIDYFQKYEKVSCCNYLKEILVYNKLPYNNLGCFNNISRILNLNYNGDKDTFKNTIVHELTHAKFNIDLRLKNKCLWDILIRDCDPAIYMINEYMACKSGNKYSFNLKELEHINSCQDNFQFYYKQRKIKDNALKELASLICNIIISEDILKQHKYKTRSIYINHILDIKKVLETIDFIPQKEQYENLVSVLRKKRICSL